MKKAGAEAGAGTGAALRQRYVSAGGLIFMFGVAWVLANVYVLLKETSLYPTCYAIQMIILLCYRVWTYYLKLWHHYCLDFCYFLNLLQIVYTLAFPSNKWLFSIFFILANGPVLEGALLFRNSLVFHDLQTFMTLFMHIGPAICAYSIRWTNGHNFVPRFDCPMSDTCTVEQRIISMFLVPVAVYCAHMFAYTIYVWVLPIHKNLRAQKDYSNAFIYFSTAWGESPLWYGKLLRCCGTSFLPRMCTFVAFNVTVAAFVSGLAVSYYYVQAIHLSVLSCVGAVCAYNGGTLYFHAFSDGYISKFFGPKPWSVINLPHSVQTHLPFPLPFIVPPQDFTLLDNSIPKDVSVSVVDSLEAEHNPTPSSMSSASPLLSPISSLTQSAKIFPSEQVQA